MYCTQAGFNPVPARGIRTTHTVVVRMPRAGMGIECGLRHWRMMKIVEITFVTHKLQHRTFPIAPQICDSRPRFSPNLSFAGHEVLSTHTVVVAFGDHRFGWSQEGEEEVPRSGGRLEEVLACNAQAICRSSPATDLPHHTTESPTDTGIVLAAHVCLFPPAAANRKHSAVYGM